MSETGEAPKASAPSGNNKRRLQWAIYWSIYVSLIGAFVAGMMGLDALGLPKWAVYTLMIGAVAVAIWWLEESPLNLCAYLDKDPFGRGFLTVNRHMVRAWALRRRDVDWRESGSPSLPPHVVHAFNELDVDPEVSVETDGLLWVAGTRDWYGWPDPPRFAVVGFDAQGKVRATDDLHAWPKRWRIPLSPIQGRYNG